MASESSESSESRKKLETRKVDELESVQSERTLGDSEYPLSRSRWINPDQPRSFCWWIQCCGSPGCSVLLPNLSADASESSESSTAKLTITVTITPLPQGVYLHHERGIRSMRSEYFLTRSVHLFPHSSRSLFE